MTKAELERLKKDLIKYLTKSLESNYFSYSEAIMRTIRIINSQIKEVSE